MAQKKDLDYYLAQARRIAEHREAGAEKEIRKLYKSMLKDLQGFVSEAYVKYANGDDKLTFADLQAAGYNARFLEEIEKQINVATPKAAKELEQLVKDTYKLAYEGMVDGVREAGADGLDAAFAESIAITPEQIKRAVENPVSGLTLKDTLEKHRKDIIYGIKQTVGIGLMNGDRYSTMARRIAEHVDGDYKKAVRIARTETHRVCEAGNHDAALRVDEALQKGTTGLRMVKRWRTMKDERVRPQRRRKGKKKGWTTKMGSGPNHMILDGQTVLEDEPFDLKDGHKAMMPGSSGVAGHDINCRCYASRKMMTDAEYFAATGKHFPNGAEPKSTPLPEITDAMDFGYGDYTQDDYNKWWDEYEEHNKRVKLSDKELEVIDNYTEGAYVSYNGVSRGDIESLKKKGYTDADIEQARKNADVLEGALRKFDLDTNIVTHRFERDVSWLTGTDNSVEALENMIGKQYTAKGFTSSGMLPNRFRFTGGKSDAVHFEIVTPKGTNGAFLSMSKKGENEFLYNRNTRFQIIDGGERIIKEQKFDMKTLKMVEVEVKERFLKVQVVLDDGLKKSGNSGIIPLKSCKNFDDLSDALKNAYSISVDDSVRKLNFRAVNNVMPGVQSMLDEFPELAKSLTIVTTSKSGVMACAGEKITFNPFHFADESKVAKMCKESSESGWWVKNCSPDSIGVHECAHGLEWMLVQGSKAYDYDFQRIDAWNKCTEAKKIVSQACKNVKKTPYGKGKRNAELITSISRYAADTPSETMAEAFADVYANGDKANPLSAEIRKLTLESLKELKGG